MVKFINATSRGQITLPKKWRDKFDTNSYKMEIQDHQLVIIPLHEIASFEEEMEERWQEYLDGKTISQEELLKKYGLSS